MPADSPRFAAATLSFVAGFVDTLCFMALFGLFTAHVTGNFVLIGSELAHPSQGTLLKWLAFPAFVLGVVAAWLLDARGNGARAMVWIQCLLLTAGLGAGVVSQPLSPPGDVRAIAAGALVCCAMGVQNAAARLSWGLMSPTTVMTGNVTQLVIDLLGGWRSGSAEARVRAMRLAGPIAAFAVGAVSGGFAHEAAGFWALLLPLILLALLASRT